MDIKTKLYKIFKVNSKERDQAYKSVKATEYNEIKDGEYKGWYQMIPLVPSKGVKMSIWTKEQESDLDNRFNKVYKHIDGVEIRLTKHIDSVEKDVKEILSILKAKA